MSVSITTGLAFVCDVTTKLSNETLISLIFEILDVSLSTGKGIIVAFPVKSGHLETFPLLSIWHLKGFATSLANKHATQQSLFELLM